MAIQEEISDLISRDKITSVLIQYCRAVDRRDLDGLKGVYWPDAIDNHGLYKGNAHAFCEMNVQMAQSMVHLTQHILGNVDCRIEGDRAYAESSVLAYHRLVGDLQAVRGLLGDSYVAQYADAGADTHDFLVGGQYFDHFERRDNVWKIVDRVASADWAMAQPGSSVSREGALQSATDLGIDLKSAFNLGPHIPLY